MEHLLKCPMRSQECATEDLMEYNEAANECVPANILRSLNVLETILQCYQNVRK